MTKETFNLINAVKCEGTNYWGVVENVNTREYLGTEESINLIGHYLYVYRKDDEVFAFISKFTPKYTATNGVANIDLYKLD